MYNQHKILRVLQLIGLLKARPPKSLKRLSAVLGSTERTVYRYLDLLTELGFVVERDEFGHVYIDGADEGSELKFTPDETQLLRRLIMTVGKQSQLRDGILKKLHVISDVQMGSEHLLKAHLGKIVESLSGAIRDKRQVVLKKYHSVNSNAVSDRRVEPIGFTDNCQSLVAYELKSGQNKYFKVERISAVEVTTRKMVHESKHNFEKPDVFGFSLGDARYPVELLLTMRAYVLLREEYPMAVSVLTKDGKSGKYRFKADVYDLKPVARFVLGFPEDIQIVGSDALKVFLGQIVRKLVGRK